MIRAAARASCLLLLVVLTARVGAGQVVLEGQVLDAESGSPLPAATVQLVGHPIGAVSNQDGFFRLMAPALPATLVARYVGYRSTEVVLSTTPNEVIRIALEPDPVRLDEIVVSGENPADLIMRRVLEAKEAWRDSVSTAYAEVYSRFMLYANARPVQLEETIGAHWWRAGDGVREVVRARRTRPVRAERFRYAQPLVVPNLYGDEVQVDGTRFITPLHPSAFTWYRFTLTATRTQDGVRIFDIAFAPDDETDAAFIGGMAVQDSTYDVLSITARPLVDRVGPPPVLERSVRLSQQFVRRGGGMLPAGFQAEGWVRFGRAGVGYPVARYRQVAGLSLHATRVALPDSLFRGPQTRWYAEDSDRQGWLFSWNPGGVPLSEQEVADLAQLDPERSLAQSFRPEGLLSQYAAVPVTEAPPEEIEEPARLELFRPWLWYNRVDGWHVGAQPRARFGEHWQADVRFAFDEARYDSGGVGALWDATSGGVSVQRLPERGLTLEAGADRMTSVVGIGSHRSRFLSGLATYAGVDDYFDYYWRRRVYGRAGWAAGRFGATLGLATARHRSVPRNDSFDGWLLENEQRPNPPIDDGRLTSATLHLRVGRIPDLKRYDYTWVDVDLEGSSKRFGGSDFSFLRWHAAVAMRRPTWLRRRERPASMRITLISGGGTVGMPIQRYGVLDVASGPLAADAGLFALRGRLLSRRTWAGVFWEHDFGSLFTAWAGLGETTFGVVLFGGHAQGFDVGKTWRHEFGMGLTAPFNLPVRVNIATSTAGLNPIVSVTLRTKTRLDRLVTNRWGGF